MELWRDEHVQGLNFAAEAYADLLPLLKSLSEVRGSGAGLGGRRGVQARRGKVHSHELQ